MSKQAVALIAALFVAGLLVVGCGGDDDNDASAGSPGAETTSASAESDAGGGEADGADEAAPTITKTALIKQGDRICLATEKRVSDKGTELIEGAEQGTQAEEFQLEVTETVIGPEFLALADDLESLGVPSGDEEEVEAFLDTVRQRGDLATNDPEAFLKLEGETGGPLEKKVEKQSRQYGFKQCMQA